MIEIDVDCRPTAEGWTCRVTLRSPDGSRTMHDVSLTWAERDRLAPGAPDPTDLVRRSFAFLLAREPKESILRRFDLPMIGRYFPEYEATIREA